jgi:small subunit ribosomal protein S16
MGRKKKAHYRIVVADNDSPRDGRFIESIGYYKPLSNPARLVLNLERVDHWLSEGAQPSGTMKSLIAKARKGGDSLVALGEADPKEQKAKRAEALAARRAAEERAAQKVAAAKAVEEPVEEAAVEEPVEEAAVEEPVEEEAVEEPVEEEEESE